MSDDNDHSLKFTPYFDTEFKEKQEIFNKFQPIILADQLLNPECKLFVKKEEKKIDGL